jgi:hypothetical protein
VRGFQGGKGVCLEKFATFWCVMWGIPSPQWQNP